MAQAMRRKIVAENNSHKSSDETARSAAGAAKASAIMPSPKPAAATVCVKLISPRAL